MACTFKNALGKPGEGIHSLRIGNIAIVDTLLAVLLGLILAKILKISKFQGMLLAIALSIIFHKIFCVETTITNAIGEAVSEIF